MKVIKHIFNKFVRIQLILIAILLSSCIHLSDLKSPLEGIKVLVNYNIFKTFLSFRFVDSVTGLPIGQTGSEKVKVQITGSSSPAIVDQLGNHKDTYETVFGLLSLALNPKDPWKPSPQNILSLQIDATSANYKPASLTLQIDSAGKYEYRVVMEKPTVDVPGIKKYSVQLNLNGSGELIDNFNYRTLGGEAAIKLNKGTRFLNSSGQIEKGSSVGLTFTVYTSLGAVPAPNALMMDVVLQDKSIQKSAIDIYRVVNVQFTNQASDILTASVLKPIIVRYKIEGNSYNPQTKSKIVTDNNVHTYTYLTKSTAWQFNDVIKLQSDTAGLFVESPIKYPGLNAVGIHINTCSMSSQISFQLPGVFPAYPVSTLVYLYRKIDSRYISGMQIDLPEKGFTKTIDFKVPENTPIRYYLRNYSASNSFTAKPDFFDYDSGCGSLPLVETLFTSTSVGVTGRVKINFGDGFPNDQFMIKANIFLSQNNALLWSKQYSVSKTGNEFDLNANLPQNSDVYIQIQTVDLVNTFDAFPANYTFNTTLSKALVWQFNLTSLYTQANFNFNFTRSTDLPGVNYTVKGVLTNMDNQNNEGEFLMVVKPGQANYSSTMILSRTKRYQLNLKRVGGTPDFIAYAYEFVLGAITQKDYNYTCELSNVVKKPVTIHLKVVCNKSEIIPTLHGYYRTVWEDAWQENDIVNGEITISCEMNSTYVIGLIVDGVMKTTTYKVDGTNFNFNFDLGDADCAKMGW